MALHQLIHRRQLITGLVSLIAAPAIVKRSSIMPVKALPVDGWIGGIRFGVNPVNLFQPGGFVMIKSPNGEIIDRILNVSVNVQGNMCLNLVSSGCIHLRRERDNYETNNRS